MKNNLLIILVLLSTVSFAQQNKEDLAIVKHKNIVKISAKKAEAVKALPSLDMKTSITKGFSSGNVKLLSVHFLANIDVSVVGKESLYSKSQAEQVLKTFFDAHRPSSFVMNHEGKSTNVKYYIGTLSTSSKKYRITVNVKIVNNTEKISGITIELN